MRHKRTGVKPQWVSKRDAEREIKKKEFAYYRSLTNKQKKVYQERKELTENAWDTIVDFFNMFNRLKVKTPSMSLGTHIIEDFAETYVPRPVMPDRGNTRKERRIKR